MRCLYNFRLCFSPVTLVGADSLALVICLLFAAPSIASDDPPFIEEILVTAQKRSENIRDVPLSISVFSSDFLESAGIADMRDMSKFTPNVEIDPENKSAKIRGIGGSSGVGGAASLLTDPAVALVVDGVYYGRSSYLFMGVLDIDRVEILRGPQGLIVGKSASAGAINFYSKRPNAERQTEFSAQVGRFDELNRSMVLNGPIFGERVTGRVALLDERSDGPFYNTTTGKHEGGVDSFTAKYSILARVTDQIDAFIAGGRTDRFKSQALSQFTVLTNNARSVHSQFDPQVEDNSDYRVSHNTPEYRFHKGDWWSAEIDWAGEEVSITSITGWAASDDGFAIDGDRGPADFIPVVGSEHYKQVSEELRLVSSPGRLEYTMGLYYFASDMSGSNFTVVGNNEDEEIVQALTNNSELFTPTGSLLVPLTGFTDLPSGLSVKGIFDQEARTIAAFAQVKYKVTDSISLTGGARHTEDKKQISMQKDNGPDGAEAVIEAAINSQDFSVSRVIRERDLPWSLSAGYEVADNISLYLTRSRGFKAGGFNSAALQKENVEYEPEASLTSEAGLKSRLFNGRVLANIGLYETDFTNMQVLTSQPGLLSGLIATNAAGAIVKGVEADAMLAITPGLSAFLTVAYNDAKFDSYPGAPCSNSSEEESCDLSGKPLANAPRWKSSLSVSYSFDVNPLNIRLSARADAMYSGFTYLETDLDPLDTQSAVTQYNMSVGVEDMSGRWSLSIRHLNVTDELIKIRGGDVALFSGSHIGSFDLPRRTVAKLTFKM